MRKTGLLELNAVVAVATHRNFVALPTKSAYLPRL